ncbi:Caspase domain [Trypanosoma vivax]|uniref:Putative metacaspase 5 n=1 Tax=Trypanosoma vivax (strain Y486) TaxID=1055687 RepID=G0U3N4_TRYVY|nr:Caspase domain [Trypanosoma vivax]CCC50891.1 putative metacaspase 5 [Trypanosoma vivax Y486]
MNILTDLFLGQVVPSIIPYLVNSIGTVQRPKRVDVRKELQRAHECRPSIPYRVPTLYTGGRVKALLIGINYTGKSGQLSGCVNDVRCMLSALHNISFPITDCCILVDEEGFRGNTAEPTRANILKHMAWLVYDTRPGDVLFFHYSGHGTQTKSTKGSPEKYDQCLVPLDYDGEGAILDDDLFDLLVKHLPAGVRMTAVFDCCHSASLLDLPFSFVGNNSALSSSRKEMRMVRQDNFSRGDVVMFSGCEDSGTSADVANTSSFGNGGRAAGGAATQAFIWTLLNTHQLNYADIFLKTRDLLRKKKFKQVPQMSSSKPVDLYKPFSLFGPITVDNSVAQQYQHWLNASAQPPYPPQQHAYPQQQRHHAYPPQQHHAYPPQQQHAYPPQQQHAYPPQQQHAYPPQQHHAYPPPQHHAYAPQQQHAYPPQQHHAYPPQQQHAYPPQQHHAYPPQQQHAYPQQRQDAQGHSSAQGNIEQPAQLSAYAVGSNGSTIRPSVLPPTQYKQSTKSSSSYPIDIYTKKDGHK